MSSPTNTGCDWLTTEAIEADIDTIAESQLPSDDETALQTAYEELVDYAANNTPSVVRILMLHTTMDNKMHLLMLYQAYQASTRPLEKFDLMKAYSALYAACAHEEQSGVHATRDTVAAEPHELLKAIKDLDVSAQQRAVIMTRYKQLLAAKNSGDAEARKLQTWIQNALRLPFRQQFRVPDIDANFLATLRSQLDEHLYGLNHVKEQLLACVLTRYRGATASQTIGLVGPPGVGKTKLAFTLAKTLGMPFAYLSFGGVHNADALRGHDYTYLASQPGMLAKALMTMGVNNGIVYIDEFDKGLQNEHCLSTLLHLLDPEQNAQFTDNYFQDITLDFSNVWFILSMNHPVGNSAVSDRITYIDIPAYSDLEKERILVTYMFPKEIHQYATNNLLPMLTLSIEGAGMFLSLVREYRECFHDTQCENFPSLRVIKQTLHLMLQRMLLTNALGALSNPLAVMPSYRATTNSTDTLSAVDTQTMLKPILEERRRTKMHMRRRASLDKLHSMYQ